MTLKALLVALNNQETKKDIKLNVEAELQPSNRCEVKIKSIEMDRELLKELGIEPKAIKEKEGKVKQPTLKELMIQGFENINKRLDHIERRVAQVEVSLGRVEERLETIEKLPTIQKELALIQALDKEHSR